MTAFEMAKKYYPVLWDDARLEQLVEAGVLSQEDMNILQNAHPSSVHEASEVG